MSPGSSSESRDEHDALGVGSDVLAEHAGVELVAWPTDERRRQQLARAGVPRLLIVAPDAEAPTSIGIDEDWVRTPCETRDVAVRLERLARVIDRLRHDRPVIDTNHILHYGGATAVLSRAQAVLVTALLDRPGTIVARESLESAIWPDGAPGHRALDGVVFRLRRRLAGLGLVIRSAHGRGFALDVHELHAERPTAV